MNSFTEIDNVCLSICTWVLPFMSLYLFLWTTIWWVRQCSACCKSSLILANGHVTVYLWCCKFKLKFLFTWKTAVSGTMDIDYSFHTALRLQLPWVICCRMYLTRYLMGSSTSPQFRAMLISKLEETVAPSQFFCRFNLLNCFIKASRLICEFFIAYFHSLILG